MLPILCQISLPWQRGLIAGQNNPLLGARILMIFPIQIELWSILSQISLPWQQGLVVVEFV